MTTTTTALQAARDEGLMVFAIYTHVGGSHQILAASAEDTGCRCDSDGNILRDWNGNTVAKWSVRPLEDGDADLALAWYEGD